MWQRRARLQRRQRLRMQSGAQGLQRYTAVPRAKTGTGSGGQVLLAGRCRQQPAERKCRAAQLLRWRERLCSGTWAVLRRAQWHAVALPAWQTHALQRRGRALRCMAHLRVAASPQRLSQRPRPRTTVAPSRCWSRIRRRNGACRGGCRWTLMTRRPRLALSRRASCYCLGRCSPLARCAAVFCWQ